MTVTKKATAGEGLRLLIREYEYFFTDEDPDIQYPMLHSWQPTGFVRSRVVYADVFPLLSREIRGRPRLWEAHRVLGVAI